MKSGHLTCHTRVTWQVKLTATNHTKGRIFLYKTFHIVMFFIVRHNFHNKNQNFKFK